MPRALNTQCYACKYDRSCQDQKPLTYISHGTAQVAASMMGAALPAGACAARLMLFVGGPSTEGSGKVVDKELSEPIRSHEARPRTSQASSGLCTLLCIHPWHLCNVLHALDAEP